MTESEFRRLAEAGYNRIPLVAEARADLYTPLALYLALAGGAYSYLLESVMGGERFGRYSFIGLACAERIEARTTAHGSTVRRLLRDARGTDVCLESFEGDPFEYVRGWLKRHRAAPAPAALRFGGGLVGYFGYEMVRHVEKHALKAEKPDPLGTPDLLLLVSDELAVVDNVLGKLYFVVYADPSQSDALQVAKDRLERLRARLARPLPENLVLESTHSDSNETISLERSFTEAGYLAAAQRAKDYVLAGDVMQVQVSQRTSRRFDLAARAVPGAARISPSPYMYYFDFGGHHVVGRRRRSSSGCPAAGDAFDRSRAARGATPRRMPRPRRTCSPTRRSAPST